MTVPETLLQISVHSGCGYRPMVDFGQWRVALLNYSEDLRPEKIVALQRHNETDEVFVLLHGRCLLFVGDGDDDRIVRIHAQLMKPETIYNVRRAVWHSHTLSRDAKVLVVENRETTYDNSPFCRLTEQQCATLRKMAARHGFSFSAST